MIPTVILYYQSFGGIVYCGTFIFLSGQNSSHCSCCPSVLQISLGWAHLLLMIKNWPLSIGWILHYSVLNKCVLLTWAQPFQWPQSLISWRDGRVRPPAPVKLRGIVKPSSRLTKCECWQRLQKMSHDNSLIFTSKGCSPQRTLLWRFTRAVPLV